MIERLHLIFLALGLVVTSSCGAPATDQPAAKTATNTTTSAGANQSPFKLTIEASDPARVVIIAEAPADFWRKHASDLESVLQFGVAPGEGMLGKYQLQENRLTFTPAFPLVEGESYVARFLAPQPLMKKHQVPAVEVPQPKLLAIYPSGNILPANHLKFYLVFSEPMADSQSFDHLQLMNLTRKKPVVDPFRRTELWSADGKVFTLWLHPGRQKAGVNLNVELGAILEPKERFELIVSKDWLSAAGRPLGAQTRKRFSAGPKEDRLVRPRQWHQVVPTAGSTDPLVLTFDRPLDWALLHSELRILDRNGQPIAGKISTTNEEKRWQFTPAKQWQSATYSVSVAAVVEDLAGNNLRRPFEVDVKKRRGAKDVGKGIEIPFQIR